MKKILFFALIVSVLSGGVTGCKKIVKKVFQGIDTEIPEFTVTLPPIPYVFPGEAPIGTLTQPFNLDSTVKANTNGVFGADDVSSVKIKQIVFTLPTADQENNGANFESARITFASNSKADTVTVAAISFPDTFASTSTYVSVNSPELKPYLNGSELYYNIFGKMRRITTKNLPLKINVTLRVE